MSGGERLGTFGSRTVVTSMRSSAITSRTQAWISAGSSPASMRQSMSATASGGMTLIFSLARSMLIANVVRTIAACWRCAKNPVRKAGSRSDAPRSSKPRPSSGGSTRASARKYSCTSGSTRGGRSAASRRPSARMRRCGAVSGHGIEPWPGRPRAVRDNGSPVFSEMMIEANGARLCGSVSMPASSDSAYSAPASQSGCVAATYCAP